MRRPTPELTAADRVWRGAKVLLRIAARADQADQQEHTQDGRAQPGAAKTDERQERRHEP